MRSFFLLTVAMLIGGAMMAAVASEKTSLDEAKARLDRAKSPVERARAYMQISDVLLKEVNVSISKHDNQALSDWSEQYRQAVNSAGETMMASGRDAYRDPEGYMDIEILLRQHINALANWKRKNPDNKPIEDSLSIAVEVRKEMLDMLFPVIGEKPKG